ncbi:hypothetical protein VCHE09_1938 [Vibrio paracholerae HE-09]|nr:hypothetical protein VCHE09_1938 [Vibrio paracholerae HE-09]
MSKILLIEPKVHQQKTADHRAGFRLKNQESDHARLTKCDRC